MIQQVNDQKERKFQKDYFKVKIWLFRFSWPVILNQCYFMIQAPSQGNRKNMYFDSLIYRYKENYIVPINLGFAPHPSTHIVKHESQRKQSLYWISQQG